jgi:hypothetical protein
MPFSEANFLSVFQTLRAVDLDGEDGPPYPFQPPPSSTELRTIVDRGARSLPLVFRKSYVEPLVANLDAIVENGSQTLVESLTGAVYQHAQPELKPQLDRLLAVVSNLYRSFLAASLRSALNVPLVETLPPLATFAKSGRMGPFTYTCDDIKRHTGGTVGVVSLPSAIRRHPILWSTLAHETGGHDVLHADSGLLAELEAGVNGLFDAPPLNGSRRLSPPQAMAAVWRYWMEEAASDAYAVLNMGPTFALNLAAYFAALTARSEKIDRPRLPTVCGFNPGDPTQALDTHPPDLLRISVVCGVVEELAGLDRQARQRYIGEIEAVATLCQDGADSVKMTGLIGEKMPVDFELPLVDMQKAARKLGGYIANARLKAFDGTAVQEIETWDDSDETVAVHIAELFLAGAPAAAFGDDAQLLAGANLALFHNPGQYDTITRGLEAALDVSYAKDPYWAKIQPDGLRAAKMSTDLGQPDMFVYRVARAAAGG